MSRGSIFAYFLDLEYPIIYNREHKPRNREPKLNAGLLSIAEYCLTYPLG